MTPARTARSPTTAGRRGNHRHQHRTHRGNVAGLRDALVRLGSELKRRTDLDGDLDGVPRLMVVTDRADGTLRYLAR